jgi:hypothetical protein
MPIVKTQGGKVVTKDGKVSCACCAICNDNNVGIIPIDEVPHPYHYKRIDGATYQAIRENGFELNYEFNIDATRGTLANTPFSLTAAIPYNGNCVNAFPSDVRGFFVTSHPPNFASIRLAFFIVIQDSPIVRRIGEENLQTWPDKENEPPPSTGSPFVYFFGSTGFLGLVSDGELFRAEIPVDALRVFGFETVAIATGGSTIPVAGAELTFLGDPIAATYSNNFTGLSVKIDISIAAP